MFRDLLEAGINFTNRRKDLRINIRARLCAFSLAKYDPKTDLVTYGCCRALEIKDIGPNGVSVFHDGFLKKGDILEFRTRYSIEDKACVKCPWFREIAEDLPIKAFIGKVIWRSDAIAGLSFIMIHEKDRTYLKKLAESRSSKR